MTRLRVFSLLIFFSIWWPLQAVAEGSSSSADIFSRTVVVILIALVITIVSVPYFYRRSLRKRGSKSLRGFLLNDPNTREALLSKTSQAQSREQSEGDPTGE